MTKSEQVGIVMSYLPKRDPRAVRIDQQYHN